MTMLRPPCCHRPNLHKMLIVYLHCTKITKEEDTAFRFELACKEHDCGSWHKWEVNLLILTESQSKQSRVKIEWMKRDVANDEIVCSEQFCAKSCVHYYHWDDHDEQVIVNCIHWRSDYETWNLDNVDCTSPYKKQLDLVTGGVNQCCYCRNLPEYHQHHNDEKNLNKKNKEDKMWMCFKSYYD